MLRMLAMDEPAQSAPVNLRGPSARQASLLDFMVTWMAPRQKGEPPEPSLPGSGKPSANGWKTSPLLETGRRPKKVR